MCTKCAPGYAFAANVVLPNSCILLDSSTISTVCDLSCNTCSTNASTSNCYICPTG